jgi:hypothetical protein
MILPPVRQAAASLGSSGLAILALGLAAGPIRAQAPAQNQPPPRMEEISPGVYRLGKMRLDKKARTLSFPASVNMDEGAVEYLLVSPHGCAHESLLATDVRPSDIHFAMLLLGAEGAPTVNTPGNPPQTASQMDLESLKNAPKPGGDAIQISVRWKEEGSAKTTPVEDWLFHTETEKAMPRGPWLYSGSYLSGQTFAAEAEGNLAAVVLNSAALINNPRNGNTDDRVWLVHKEAVPKKGTPVELTLTLSGPLR